MNPNKLFQSMVNSQMLVDAAVHEVELYTGHTYTRCLRVLKELSKVSVHPITACTGKAISILMYRVPEEVDALFIEDVDWWNL